MKIARAGRVDLSVAPYYHCMARCVRRAFLCGQDEATGMDSSHRKGWIRERIRHLASLFAIDVCAYAVMSNHLHVVLHADKDRALSWTDEEVIERHTKLYPLSRSKIEGRLPKGQRRQLLELWRTRLYDISWLMRGLNEFIARQANKEDQVRGRFWEGRFESQALVDESGLIACMVYVDFNPVRAGIAGTLETSDFTFIQERLADQAKKRSQRKEQSAPRGMASFYRQSAEAGRAQIILPIAFKEYVQLVEWTGELLANEGRFDPKTEPSILSQQGTTGRGWAQAQRSHVIGAASALGSLEALQSLAEHRGKRSVRGIGVARSLAS